MAQPEPDQRPMSDDEIEEGRDRLKEFFNDVAEGLADETGRTADEFRPDHD